MENTFNGTSLVCPKCKRFLKNEPTKYICNECSLNWIIKNNIPVFSDNSYLMINDNEISQLAKRANSADWQEALFEYTKKQIEKDANICEDQRSADWRYLLPLNEKNEALVIGCGLGTVPVSLSEICKKVYIVDTNLERLTFIEIRKQQQRIKNIFPILIDTLSNLPFPDHSFDLVVIYFSSDLYQIIDQFEKLAIIASKLLKNPGHAYFSTGNFISLFNLMKVNKYLSWNKYLTYFGYKSILQKSGFNDIKFIAPLPSNEGIPLFYIPLENRRSIEFFMVNVFPLFEMVSTEVKQKYGAEYKFAKLCVKTAVYLRLSILFKIFVPGYNIIANKE